MKKTKFFGNVQSSASNQIPTTVLFLFITLFTLTLVSGCSDNNDTPAVTEDPVTNDDPASTPNTSESGTIAASPEALRDFMFQSDNTGLANEFWLCEFSDGSADSYIALTSIDDEADPDFDPLLLLGKTRDEELEGDPRNPLIAGVGVDIFFITALITSRDQILIEIRDSGYSGSPDLAFDFNNIRLGPGRVFTTDSTFDNNRLTCTATDVGERVVF